MKSSSGKYFIGLDHIRAAAAIMVFTWHFVHVNDGQLSPPPVFPLSLFSEGHTGVALFMALSGYLFAKLLDGKKIIYKSFIWNRILRLAPLLLVIVIIVGVQRYFEGADLFGYVKNVVAGVVRPSLPNGGWSITAEFHFYLLLPGLLFLTNRWRYSLFVVLMAAVLLRTLLFQEMGEIQSLSFWTIVGRIDQFLLGILAYQFRDKIAGKHFLVVAAMVLFAGFYWYFDYLGGFFLNPSYPSPSPIWIFLPTAEGLVYSLVIAWYDNSFEHSTGRVSQFIALIGTYSYSIYLTHFFVVFKLSNYINDHWVDLSNLHMAMLFSILCFPLMMIIGYFSYRFIEIPALKFRTKYIVENK